MGTVLKTLRKIIPKSVFTFFQPYYHLAFSFLGSIIYRHPSKKLNIIGVTGTKGKSTTVEILNSIFREAGYKTAMSGTIHFKIGDKTIPNKYKMSMPGRFFMQKFLHDAVKDGCTWAFIEMTSEGAKLNRHKFIDLNGLIFTNLSPEHIEAHGSFKKYKDAKLQIAKLLETSSKDKTFFTYNADDNNSKYFLDNLNGVTTIPFSLTDAKPYDSKKTIKMRFGKSTIYSNLRGDVNIYNILAAATAAKYVGVNESIIKNGVEKVNKVLGRFEPVNCGQDFDVIVDYAHTTESLSALYESFPRQKKICVLGNTGGGRDTWKRPEMAKVAEKYCSEIILTNEDPYDEDPEKIVNEMKQAITKKPVKVIMDRREAIHYALSKATKNNAVLISGKGTDPYIMEANGKKTPWSDSKVATEELRKVLSK